MNHNIQYNIILFHLAALKLHHNHFSYFISAARLIQQPPALIILITVMVITALTTLLLPLLLLLELLKKNQRSPEEEAEIQEHAALSVLHRWGEMNEFIAGVVPLVPEHVEIRSLMNQDNPGLPQVTIPQQ